MKIGLSQHTHVGRMSLSRRCFATRRLLFLPLLFLISSQVKAQTSELDPTPTTFQNFEAGLSGWSGSAPTISLNSTAPLQGTKSMQVYFPNNVEWPTASYIPSTQMNWSSYDTLLFQMKNASAHEIEIGMRVDNPGTDGTNLCRTSYFTIPGNISKTFAFPLHDSFFTPNNGTKTESDLKMRGMPRNKDVRNAQRLTTYGVLNTSQVTALHFFIHYTAPAKPSTTILIDNLRLSYNQKIDNILDMFGQYKGENWTGKVTSTSSLWNQGQTDINEVAPSWGSTSSNWSSYGGWKNGPRQTSRTYFKTQKINGKWWLVDPDGYLFFSTGINAINIDDTQSLYDGWVDQAEYNTGINPTYTRLFMFGGSLPSYQDPASANYQIKSSGLPGVGYGRTYSNYGTNLQHKYGTDINTRNAAWTSVAVKRMRKWGFNTVGNWSDGNFAWRSTTDRLPFVIPLGVPGSAARLNPNDAGWGWHVDPFDSSFASQIATAFDNFNVAGFKTNSHLIGYFVDNELPWGDYNELTPKGYPNYARRYALVYATLSRDSSVSAAKRELISQLKTTYNSNIWNLNIDWGKTPGGSDWIASWEALSQPYYPSTSYLTAAQKQDFANFLYSHAKRYFSVINAQLKQRDPNHLYLGCRFASRTSATPEALVAAKEECDIVSFNAYETTINSDWNFLTTAPGPDKPYIIGEFHFGAVDRGMFHAGLQPVSSQSARGTAYSNYMNSVLKNPLFVGAHWFQYTDEPLLGRTWDGENYNIGLVDVTDKPYSALVNAATSTHNAMYTTRNNAP